MAMCKHDITCLTPGEGFTPVQASHHDVAMPFSIQISMVSLALQLPSGKPHGQVYQGFYTARADAETAA